MLIPEATVAPSSETERDCLSLLDQAAEGKWEAPTSSYSETADTSLGFRQASVALQHTGFQRVG